MSLIRKCDFCGTIPAENTFEARYKGKNVVIELKSSKAHWTTSVDVCSFCLRAIGNEFSEQFRTRREE